MIYMFSPGFLNPVKKKYITVFLAVSLLFFSISLFAQSNGNDIGSNSGNAIELDFDECDDTFEIHPQDSDFKDGYGGRILISHPEHGGGYYNKDYNYQNGVSEVEIEFLLPMDYFRQNRTVYFRIIEEDLDDLSPYEYKNGVIDTDPEDNLDDNPNDAIGKNGILESESTGQNGLAVEAKVDRVKYIEATGITKGKARVILNMNNVAGNDYTVEASINADFSGQTYRTTTMYAWKRIYVEVDKMYKSGACLTQTHTDDGDNNNDWLFVDNTNSFYDNVEIFLFDNNGNEIGLFVEDVDRDNNKILVSADIKNTFPRYSGIRLKDVNEFFGLSPEAYITDVYGSATDGSDCGSFLEIDFNSLSSYNNLIPLYTSFSTLGQSVGYANYWFSFKNQQNNDRNVIHIISAYQHNEQRPGYEDAVAWAQINGPNTLIFDLRHEAYGSNKETAKSENVVHEIVHNLGIMNDHIDSNVNCVENSECNGKINGKCTMTYCHDRTDGMVDFDKLEDIKQNCYFLIRTVVNPI